MGSTDGWNIRKCPIAKILCFHDFQHMLTMQYKCLHFLIFPFILFFFLTRVTILPSLSTSTPYAPLRNIHNPDATMIQPEWHGWMHHVFDETPAEMDALAEKRRIERTSLRSDAVYTHHIGKQNPTIDKETVDTSQWRQRGYRVGSLHTGPDDADLYYKQPGHPLSEDKNGSFKERKGQDEWNPNA